MIMSNHASQEKLQAISQ